MENQGGGLESRGSVAESPGSFEMGAVPAAPEMISSGEGLAEMQEAIPKNEASMKLPPAIGVVDDDTDDVGGKPEVGRDAEQIPASFMKHVAEVMVKNRDNPHKLQARFTGLKWYYMKRAFGRELGDGLHKVAGLDEEPKRKAA